MELNFCLKIKFQNNYTLIYIFFDFFLNASLIGNVSPEDSNSETSGKWILN